MRRGRRRAGDRSHAGRGPLFTRLARGRRNGRRDMLVQQRLGRANARIGMKPRPHHVIVQRVVEGEERHALVMHHVAAHDDARFAPGFAPPRIIDRLVVAVVADDLGILQRGEPAEILHRGGGLHAERERRCVRRDDQVALLSALQRQRRHAKGPVLIDVVPVERAEGGFRDAPRHAVLLGIGDLAAHRVVTRAIEQRILMRLREQHRHEVFKHRAAPRHERVATVRGAKRPAQRPPMLHRHLAARDGQETR